MRARTIPERPRLPVPDDIIVGRAALLRSVERALTQSRVVTLRGVGGVGKTRLALEHARAAPCPVLWCDLGEARGRDDVERSAALALGLTEQDGPRIGAALAALGEALVVLDEAEGVSDDVAATMRALFAAAPRARVLVTSRVGLSVEGERVIDVPPLALDPEAGDARSAAETMLVARVRRSRPRWTPSAEEADAARELLRALEGVPLAIALAAPRVAALGADAVRDRLAETLARLEDRSAPRDRHRSLRAAFDASWDSLCPGARRVAAQCAVFRGAFSLDAAEAVIDPGDAREGVAIDGALQELVERSVLRRIDTRDGPRLGTFACVRVFLAERLDAMKLGGAAEARHTRWYLQRAEYAVARLNLHGSDRALASLLEDQDNLAEILERALRGGDADSALRACVALLEVRATTDAFLARVDAAVSLGESADPPPASLRVALCVRAIARQRRGLDSADDVRRATALAAAAGDRVLVVRARMLGAIADGAAGRFVEALDELRALCDDPSASVDPRIEGALWSNLANALCELDALDEATRAYARAIAILKGAGFRRLEAQTQGNLGVALLGLGRHDEAWICLSEARALFASLPRPGLGGAVTCQLGMLNAARGAIAVGVAQLREGTRALRLAGNVRAATVFETYLGAGLACAGDARAADDILAHAEGTLREIGNAPYASLAAAYRAAAAFRAGRRSLAVEHRERARRSGIDADDAPAFMRAVWAVVANLPAVPAAPIPATPLELALVHRMVYDAPAHAAADAAQGSALVLSRAERWFRAPGAAVVDCARRRSLWRLALALAEAHTTSPGRAVSTGELFAAVWPDERLSPESARNRLHVALNALRRLGLRDALVRDAAGYRLREDLTVAILDTPAAPRPSGDATPSPDEAARHRRRRSW